MVNEGFRAGIRAERELMGSGPRTWYVETMLDLSPETEALAHSLAEARRLSVDVIVREALQAHAAPSETLLQPIDRSRRDTVASSEPDVRIVRRNVLATVRAKDMSPDVVAARKAAIDRIVAEMDKLPDLDTRSVREITDELNEL